MKIMVTGATGFIGNHVIQELLKKNHAVIATDINKQKAKEKDWFEKVLFIEHVIGEEKTGEDLFQKMHQPDCLIHLAWQGLPNYKALFHFEENLPGQYFFLKKMVNSGLKDITVSGTCFEYGMKSGCLSEDMLPDPVNAYALAKNTLRLFLEELRKGNDFNFKWVRLFYLYGKGQNPNSLLAQLDSALEKNEKSFNMSGGEQIRDYLPVEKAAEYFVKIATQKEVSGIINCCSGEPIMLKDLVQQHLVKQKRQMNFNYGHYPYPDFEPMEFWGDHSKLMQIIA